MQRTLTVNSVPYQVQSLVHRRMGSDGWAVAIPGCEELFEDAAYGGTERSLGAAHAARRVAVLLEDAYLLAHTTICIEVFKTSQSYHAITSIPNPTNMLSYFVQVLDEHMACDIYKEGSKVLLSSPQALALIGQAEVDRALAFWKVYLLEYCSHHTKH